MEGIAGILSPEFFETRKLVENMLLLLHGDEEEIQEIVQCKNGQFGLRGNKIATNPDKTILVGLDGCLGNREELKKCLCPKEDSSAMLLLECYLAFGEKYLDKIQGEFAFFLIDLKKGCIYLVRDRIGKKPLYWCQVGQHFLFGSRIKSLLATGIVPQAIDLDAFSLYLSLGYIPQDLSPIQGVSKLLPGHFLKLTFDQTFSIHSYWSYSSYFQKNKTKPLPAALEELDALLGKTVINSLEGEQEAGCMLSGGLGSSSIAYYLTKTLPPSRIQAYTVGFSGQMEEDVHRAAEVAENLGIRHTIKMIQKESFLDDLVKIIWFLDEPLADPCIISTWNLTKLAAKSKHPVFSGMGSDEILKTHTRYVKGSVEHPFSLRLTKILHSLKKACAIPLINLFHPKMAYRMLKEAKSNPWQIQYLLENSLFPPPELASISPLFATRFDQETFLRRFKHMNSIDSVPRALMYFDVKTRLSDCYLMQLSRFSSAFGLAWKTPMLDRRVIECVAAISTLDKEDSLLKDLMKNRLPEIVLQTEKKARPEFLSSWVEKTDLPVLFHLLTSGTVVETGLISEKWLQKNLESLTSMKKAFSQLFALLTLEIWFRLHINHPIKPKIPDVSVYDLLSEI